MISWQNTAKAPSELTMTLVSLDKAPPFYLEKYVSNVSRRLDYRGTVLARPGVETEAEGGGLGADWKVPTYMLEVLYDMSTGVHRSVPLGKVSQEGILCLKAMYNEVTDSNLGKIVAVRMSLTRRYESWVTAAVSRSWIPQIGTQDELTSTGSEEDQGEFGKQSVLSSYC